MSQMHRRVILTPPAASDEQVQSLYDALRQAVDRQAALAAQSPHVLRLTSDVQRDGSGFYVDHEPADPVDAASLFDRSQAPLEAVALLRWGVAMSDALSAAHRGVDGRTFAHGGLCGGTLLVTPDGIEKITDFGFAPAVCTILGTDEYLNLAVATDRPDLGTGVWEVVDAGEFDREDRLCAFIDPEKYGTMVLDTFEPGSDVIAAGFLLHLLAEHQHPYLVEPDAHRMVEMSEYMAMVRYNAARRKDLRESEDPGVQAWCQTVARMLSRLPPNRPGAGEVLDRLRPHVKAIDADELARRRLQAAIESAAASPADDVDWSDCRQIAASVLAGDADDTTATAARGLLRKAEAQLRFRRGLAAIEREDWREAAAALSEDFDDAGLSRTQAASLKQARAWIDAHATIVEWQHQLDAIAPDDPLAALSAIETLKEHAQGVAASPDWPRHLTEAHGRTLAAIEAAEATTRAAAEAARERIEADRLLAEEWLQRATDAADAEAFDAADEILKDQPKVRQWPDEVKRAARELRQRVAEARDRRQRTERASAWLARLQASVEASKWDDAARIVGERPDTTGLDDATIRNADGLCERVREAQQRTRDEAAARAWLKDLLKQAERKDWVGAAERLSRRPGITFWPEDVLAEENRIKGEVERQIEIAEVERLRIEREHGQARDWLASARRASDGSDWDAALKILEAPPPEVQSWPDGVRDEAKALAKTCREQQAREKAAARSKLEAQVRREAESHLGAWMRALIGAYVDPGRCAVAIEAIELTAESSPIAGRVSATVTVDGIKPASVQVEAPFQEGRKGTAAFEPPAPPDAADRLVDAVRQRQSAQLEVVRRKLKDGLFPGATIDCAVNGVMGKVDATLSLATPPSGDDRFPCALTWDAKTLAWSLGNTAPAIQRSIALATRSATKSAHSQLARGDELVGRYEKHVRVEVKVPADAGTGVLFGSLVLPAQVALTVPDSPTEIGLGELSVKCPRIGKEAIEGDRASVSRRLGEAITTVQKRGREALLEDIRGRAQRSSLKVKLTTYPADITAVINDLKIEVAPRRRKAVTVTAHWSESLLRFERSPGWDGILAPALAPPTAQEKGPPIGRKGLMGVGAIAALAICVAAFQMSRSNGGAKPPPTQPATSENAPAGAEAVEQEAPPPPPPAPVVAETYPDLDALVASVRTRFSESGLFDGVRLDDFVHASAAPGDATCPLTAYIPGMSDAAGAITLTVPAEGQPWGLTDQDLKRVDEPLAALKELRLTRPAADFTALVSATVAADFAGKLDAASITSRVQPVEWSLSGDFRRWIGSADASLSVGEARTVSTQPVQFEIASGELDVSNEGAIRADIRAGIERELLAIQNAAVESLSDELIREGRPVSLQVTGGAEQIVAFQPALTLTLRTDGLAPRTLTATWSPTALQFEPVVAPARLAANLQLARSALDTINRRLDADHWLRRLLPDARVVESSGVVEVSADGPGAVALAVAAPWAPVLDDPLTLIATDRLPLRLDLDRIDASGENRRISPDALEAAFPPPRYWPAIAAVEALRRDARLLTSADDAAPLPPPAGLAAVVADGGGAALIAPRFDVASGEDRPELDEASARVTAWLDARWAVTGEIARIDAPALDRLLAELQPAVRYELSGVADGRGGIRWTWQPSNCDALALGAGHVAAIKQQLGERDARERLERTLESALGRDDAAPLEPAQAWRLLRDIWVVKGAAAPPDPDLTTWTRRRRDALEQQPAHKAGVRPTVFIEYVCGRGSAYALSWALTNPQTGDPTIKEGPTLRRLGVIAELQGLSGQAAGDGLISAVLDDVPKAAAVRGLTDDYDRHVGLAIGLDGQLGSIGGAAFDELPLSTRSSAPLQISSAAGASFDRNISWSSLADLTREELSNRRCDYWLLGSLAEGVSLRSADEASRWAHSVLEQVATGS